MKVKIFRWRAIGPLLVLFVIAGILWWLFADTIARRESQKVGTQILGAQVEIQRLHLDLRHGKVLISGLTIASPHEAFKNLLQADELVADIDVVPLTEKKLIINRIAANGLRFGTPRATDGRAAATSGDGIAGRVLAETRDWASQFQIPVLQLATGKVSIDSLDPRRLSTIPAAAGARAAAACARHGSRGPQRCASGDRPSQARARPRDGAGPGRQDGRRRTAGGARRARQLAAARLRVRAQPPEVAEP